jgi:hypothetical protein
MPIPTSRPTVLVLAIWLATVAAVPTVAAGSQAGSDSGSSAAPAPEPPAFWSFQPPRAQATPGVRDRAWPRQRLDFFVLSRLESAGLHPAPPAEARALVRRVTYDLTGLPPTPGEVRDFLEDTRPDAYPRLVERLLASPRFGERLASLWLPLVRYGEDQAHQVGNDTTMFYPNAYQYRAWIIDAFNRDLPYDRFLKFQIAADLYPEGAQDLAALGFLGIGPKYYNRDRLEVLADEWEDRVDTVCRTTLGLTVACARCHDHKSDPIPTRDYYALAGIFASTRMVNKAPDGKIVEGKVQADKMPPGTLHIVEEGEPKNLPVFIRGRVDRKGPEVERGFLGLLAGAAGDPSSFKEGSGRRALAESIACRSNPLTARVFVNRLWGQLFGRPLSLTPSNFGQAGLPPSHPELLDDLAVRFMDQGWSIHTLAREIVLSAAYRQDSRATAAGLAADPANELLSRMNRRRLSVEQWRDTTLAIAGDLEIGNPKSLDPANPANRRRTVYSHVSRLQLNDLLMQFDYPDANVHSEKRSSTTTATQKLFLLNGAFVLDRASALARKLATDAGPDPADRIRLGYRLAYQRDPGPDELAEIQEFVGMESADNRPPWDQFAQVLLTSNELLFLD